MAQTPTPKLTFEVKTPERSPYRVTLTKAQNLVGRETGDIVLNDPESSALHAEIDVTGGHVIVRDLGSSNGTWRGGERLPQFALFEGQSFYCGNTELHLISVDGAPAELSPGQTAVGRTKVSTPEARGEHTTLIGTSGKQPVEPPPGWSPPSPVSLGSPAPVAETTGAAFQPAHGTLPGPHAPSSSPTTPGDHQGSASTLPSAEEEDDDAPTAARDVTADFTSATPERSSAAAPQTRSSSTVPGPAGATSATPSSRTSPQQEPTPGQPAEPAGPEVEPPAPAPAPTPGAFRPPVANAVIKSEGADKAPATNATPKKRKSGGGVRWGRLLGIGTLAALGAAAIAGLSYFVYGLLAARALAFGEVIAEELPASTIGFVALRSIDDAVELLANEEADALEELRVDAMGFDPYSATAWSEQGIETSAPVGIALLEPQGPTFAVSFGVADQDAFEDSVRAQVPKLLGLTASETTWSQREFGERPGLWFADRGVAVVHLGERSVLVFSPRTGRADDVEDLASAMGTVRQKETLAASEAFSAVIPPPGEALIMGYVDGSALRSALPAGPEALVARLALADLDALAMIFSHEDDAIHLTYEVVVREGSRHLELLDDAKRDTRALSKLPGDPLAAFDVRVNGETLDRSMGGALTALGESVAVVEKDISDELGINLRADVTQILSGGFGGALLALPSDADAEHETKAALWLGVTDDEKASRTLSRIYEKIAKQAGGDIAPREVSGTKVYTAAGEPDHGRPDFQVFVHDGFVWLLVGPLDAAEIIDGKDASVLGDARHPSIAKAMAKGDNMAAFADIKRLVEATEPLLSAREREGLGEVRELVDELETWTLRLSRKGRTVSVRQTTFTAEDVGLAGVVRTATKLMGASMSASLARASRSSRCAALAEHMGNLSRKVLEEKGAALEDAWAVERLALERCGDPSASSALIDCYLATDTMEGMPACDAKHPPRKVPTTTEEDPPDPEVETPQAEPKVVPYVDDIWPHRVDDPDSDNPQPDVNYAVPLGDDPDSRGPDDALVTIVMFGDFECPHCKAVMGTLDEVLSAHGKDVRLVFRHFPLEKIHPSAREAAKAALAASEQDGFWAMHDALYDRGSRLNAEAIDDAAKEAGIDQTRFAADRASAAVDRRLQRDLDTAAKFGVRGTPAFFVNGRYLGGRQSLSAFNKLIDEELERAKRFVERRGDTRKRLYQDMIGHFAPEVSQPETAVALPDEDAKRYTIDTSGLPRKGSGAFAQVEIIECGDFDCPYCARSRKALDEVLDDNTGVSLYFVHNPLSYHPGAEPAARAAQAAKAQDKFWEMHDALFEDQRSKARTDADYERYAARLGLDIEQFREDFAATQTAAAVETQRNLCTDNDATATPTFFINGRRVTGAQSAEQLEALVAAERSGGI